MTFILDKIFLLCYFGGVNSKKAGKMELAIPKMEQKWISLSVYLMNIKA
jgi:hypothetical protein